MAEEIKVPGVDVPEGAQVPGVGGDAEVAAPTVSPSVAAEVDAANAVAPEAPAPASEEAPVIDPMQPVGPN